MPTSAFARQYEPSVTELADSAALSAAARAKESAAPATSAGRPPALSARGADTTIGGAFARSTVPLASGAIALTGGFPGQDVLPVAELAAAFARVLGRPDAGATALQYHGPQGTDELRAWIAEDQGVPFEQVLVTNGALHSIGYVLEALIEPGDLVLVENPTYPYALRSLQYYGARVEGISTDHDGLDVAALETALVAGARPKALYLIPDFQNPTGSTLPAERRQRVAELADRYGFVILSDNPYSRLRFSGDDVPDFDVSSDLVVHANTFSKVLGPGLRLGWAVLPTWLVGPAIRTRLNTDQHPNLLVQRAAYDLLSAPGALDRIVAHARSTYAQRSGVLYDALAAGLGDRFEAQRPAGGLFLWARVPDADLARTLDVARTLGVDFTLGVGFDPTGRGLHADRARFAFSNATPAELATAAERFSAAVVQASA
jgi:2-aminoadipate transaminase